MKKINFVIKQGVVGGHRNIEAELSELNKKGTMNLPQKKVEGWAIVNTDGYQGYQIWGYYGVGVSAAQIFSSKKRAEFIMNQPKHAEEVAKGTTIIVPIELLLPLSLPKSKQ